MRQRRQMERLLLLGKVAAAPLCLPALAELCESEAKAVLERLNLRAWKTEIMWEQSGWAPPASSRRARDQCCRIECGAQNFRRAEMLKQQGNCCFRRRQWGQ